jgi:hypothetical protein
MASLINREANLKRREPKVRSSFKPQGLFGIIKSLHRKITSDPAIVFYGYPTIRMLEDCQREFELQKSKAIAHFRLQTRLI